MTKAEYFSEYAECCQGPEWDRLVQSVDAMMDACNLSGCVHSWDTIVSEVWREAHRLGKSTGWVNQHPLNVCIADKLVQLATGGCGATGAGPAYWAYEWLHDAVCVANGQMTE